MKRGAHPHTFLNLIFFIFYDHHHQCEKVFLVNTQVKQTVHGWRDWAHSQQGNAGAREDQEVPQVGHHDSDKLNKAILHME